MYHTRATEQWSTLQLPGAPGALVEPSSRSWVRQSTRRLFFHERYLVLPLSLPLTISQDTDCIQPSSESNNVLPVDYSDIDHLVSVLEANEIDTVISAFAVEGDSLAMAQLNLIEAATKSKPTRRFIPSAFAIPYPEE